MPELPEVETIVRYLRSKIRGKIILGLSVNTPRLFRNKQRVCEIRRKIIGKKIQNIKRGGKYIILELSGRENLLIHLMMTGQLILNPEEESKHVRALLELSEGNRLIFNDIRKFGRFQLVPKTQKLGGEDALTVSFKKFKELVKARKSNLKNLLLNQNILAGVGNIYADEILWEAALNPIRRANSLSDREIHNFYRALHKVLKLAIKKEGTSARNYRKPDGTEGGYYNIRKAYQRTGESCLRKDEGIIKRIVIGQRATHYCPQHQK